MLTISRSTEVSLGSAESATPFTIVRVDGDIDPDTAPMVEAALEQALDVSNAVCWDLSGVTFFGAAAGRTLFDAHRYASARRRTFCVRGATGFTAHVLNLVDPGEIVPRLP
jgi:anti-anti-sigma factor